MNSPLRIQAVLLSVVLALGLPLSGLAQQAPKSRALAIGKAPAFVGKLMTEARSQRPKPTAPYTVIASGLHAPRGLTFGSDDRLFVAEAGLGGGNNGAIDEIRNPRSKHPEVRTLVSGLASILTPPPEGDVLGVSGLSAGKEGLYAIMGESEEATGIPQLGRLLKIDKHGQVTVEANVGRANYLFTGANPQLDPGGQYPDANPYGVLALPKHIYVIDAGANTLNEILPNGTVKILAYFENNITADSTPTCVAEGPDKALYIGTLALVDSIVFGPSAKIYRIVPDQLPRGNTVPIIGQANEWATGLWPINGCAFGKDGALYVSELFTSVTSSGEPGGGDVVKIPFNHPETRISLTNETLPVPGGVAVAKDGTVYAVGLTIAPDGFVARLSQR